MIPSLGQNLRKRRKYLFPSDTMMDFALRLGVSRATLQKMEQGDLSVSMDKYVLAARLLDCIDQFECLFYLEQSLFDE